MNYRNFFLEWMNHQASSLQAPSSLELLTPAFLVTLVFVAAIGFVFFRRNTQHISIFNSFLIIAVLAGFQACGLQTKSSGRQLSGPIRQDVPPQADDLGDYIDPNEETEIIYLFSPKLPANAQGSEIEDYLNDLTEFTQNQSGVHAYQNSDIREVMAPECIQYNLLHGKLKNVSNASCRYVEAWEGAQGVREVLRTCHGEGKRLTLDLESLTSFRHSNPPNTPNSIKPLIRVEHGQPFSAYAYCISTQGDQVSVDLLNPEFIELQIGAEEGNIFSYITKLETPGWFQGAFDGFDSGGRISSKKSFIQMLANQGDVTISNPPRLDVLVVPGGLNAKMAEFQTGITLTDNIQEPIRGSLKDGIAIPANGEVHIQNLDVRVAAPGLATELGVERTYRSFNGRVGDFGYNWDWLPRREYYTFVTPVGSLGNYEFIRSGEGRLFPREIGPFLDPEAPDTPDLNKLFYLHGIEHTHFDLSGRLVSKYDGATGNRVYYVYDGSSVVLMADSIAASAGSGHIKSILDTFYVATKTGSVPYNPLNPSPSAIASDWINQYVLPKAGNFVFLLRNHKGYVQAAIDKTGNFTWYWYGDASGSRNGNGDYLVEVERFVKHSPNGVEEVGQASLYKYTYHGSSGVGGNNYPGLIKEYYSHEQSLPVAKNIKYELNTELYGAAPIIQEFTSRGIKKAFVYNFYEGEDEDNPEHNVLVHTRTAADSPLYSERYEFDRAGHLLELFGPTEKQASKLIFSARWDPKLLRPVSTITRGVKNVVEYNASGIPVRSRQCADKTESGNELQPELEGNGCPGASRVTDYSPSLFWIDEWYKDPTGTLIALNSDLPTSSLNSTRRTIRSASRGCFGGAGIERYNQATQGIGCSFSANPSGLGGNLYSWVSSETFQDGTFKSSGSSSTQVSASETVTWGANEFAGLTGMNLSYRQNHQAGFVKSVPALGFDRVHQPDAPGGQLNLTDSFARFFDPYGNVLAEVRLNNGAPTENVTVYYYDYRYPVARLVYSEEIGGLRRRSSGPITPHLGQIFSPRFIHPETGETSNFTSLASELNFALSSESALKRFFHDIRLELLPGSGDRLARLAVSSSYDPKTGNRITFGRDDPSRPDLVTEITTTYSAGCNSGQVDCFPASTTTVNRMTTTEYDDPWDRATKVVTMDGSQTSEIQYAYRSNNDRGLYKTIETLSGNPSHVKTTEEKDWDGAGRVTSIEVTETGLPKKTITIAYAPFGEVKSRSEEIEGYQALVEFGVDLGSGVLTSEATSATGEGVDTEQYVTRYSEFNAYLQPARIEDENRDIVTTYSSTSSFDRELTETVKAPETFLGSGDVTYAKSTTRYDGCGNSIYHSVDSAEIGSGSSESIVTTASVEASSCQIERVQNPSGWIEEYDYTLNGTPYFLSSLDNVVNAAFAATGTLGASFLYCLKAGAGESTPQGRCKRPGSLYSFQYVLGKVPSFPSELIASESSATHYSQGVELQKKIFLNGAFTTSSTDLVNTNEIRDPIYSVAGTSDFNLLLRHGHEISETQSATQTTGGHLTKKLHPRFGLSLEEENSRFNTRLNSRSTAVTKNTFDDVGRITQSELKLNGSVYSSMNVETWMKGIPFKLKNQRPFGPNGQLTNEEIETEILNGVLPERVRTTTNVSNGVSTDPFISLVDKSHDGLGRPKSISYTPETVPESQDFVRMDSRSDFAFDKAGRLLRSTQELTERLEEWQAKDFAFAGGAIARKVLDEPTSVSVRFDYEDPENQDGITMIIPVPDSSEEFRVQYKFLNGENQGVVRSIRTITPNNDPYLYSPFRDANFMIMPYAGHVDAGAGIIVDEGEEDWPPSNPPRPRVNLENQERPKYYYKNNSDNWISDNTHRTVEVNLNSGQTYIERINPIGFEGISLGFNWMPRTLAELTTVTPSNPTEYTYRSCDGLTWRNTSAFTHSRAQSQEPSDRETYYNDQGKPSVIKQTYYRDRTKSNEKKWILKVANAYDTYGLPAAQEQTIRFRSAGHVTFDNLQNVRVIQSRFFNVQLPFGGAVGGAANQMLVEVVKDSGNRAGYCGDAFSCNTSQPGYKYAQAPNRTGTWVYIPGPLGPISAYRKEDNFGNYSSSGTWKRYDFIYDSMGNVKNFYRYESAQYPNNIVSGATFISRKPPNQNESYGTYLNSVVVTYPPESIVPELDSEQENIVRYMVDSRKNFYQYMASFAPQVQPLQSPFGGQGYMRDILGHLYIRGSGDVYDPFLGVTLQAQKPNPEICAGSATSILSMVQSQVAKRRGVLNPLTSSSYDVENFNPTVEAQNRAVSEFVNFQEGRVGLECRGWLSDPLYNLSRLIGGSGGTPSWYSHQCFQQSRNLEWFYNKEKISGDAVVKTGKVLEVGAGVTLVLLMGTQAALAAEASLAARGAAFARAAAGEIASQYSPIPLPLSPVSVKQANKAHKRLWKLDTDARYKARVAYFERFTEEERIRFGNRLISRALNAGPNRWVKTGFSPQGDVKFIRGMSGRDENPVNEAIRLARGDINEMRFVGHVESSGRLPFNDHAGKFASPFTVQGRTDLSRINKELMGFAGEGRLSNFRITDVSEIGLHASSGAKEKAIQLLWYFYGGKDMQGYIEVIDQLGGAAKVFRTNSRGKKFYDEFMVIHNKYSAPKAGFGEKNHINELRELMDRYQ